MAPPFIAYYGALQGGSDGSNLLQLAYTQCKLYRQYLGNDGSGLWQHIVLGDGTDTTHWGTGTASQPSCLRPLLTLPQVTVGPLLGCCAFWRPSASPASRTR